MLLKFLASFLRPSPKAAARGLCLVLVAPLLLGRAQAEPTTAQRSAAIKDRFKPLPGELAIFSPEEIRDRGAKNPFQVRGFIEISPRANECLSISRGPNYPGQRVCKPQSLPFHAAELAQDGSVNWEVTTTDALEPVTLSWPTPYRLGKRMAAGLRSPTSIRSFILTSCRVVVDRRGPIMQLGILSGEGWTIHFPKDDRFVNQAPEMPELYIMGKESGPAGGITEEIIEGRRKEDIAEADRIARREALALESKKHPQEAEQEGSLTPPNADGGAKVEPKAEHKEKEEKATAESGDGGEKKEKAKEKKTKPQRPNNKRYQVYEYRGRWAIPQRNSFTMNAGNFKTLNESGDTRGSCRYQLKDAPKDPGSGWIECHNVGLDEFIFLHLPCADDLAAVRKNISTQPQAKDGQDEDRR